MAEWTDDAREYLDGYLRQVAALARRNGDDADEIVDGLREHVKHKATLGGAGTVDVDLLIEVLHEVGSPSDVIEMDAAAFARPAQSALPASARQESSVREKRPKPQVIIQKSNTGKWIFLTVLMLVFVVSIPFLLTFAAIVIPNVGRAIAPANEAAERVQELAHEEAVNDALPAKCEENMVRIGEALKMYAADHGGRYPTPFDESGNIRGFELQFMQLYPEYIENQNYGFCPAVMAEVGPASSYIYPYIAAQSIEKWVSFGDIYPKIMQHDIDGSVIPEDLKPYLFEHVEESLRASTPLVVERPRNHEKSGGYVLYLDGHVEFIHYGDKFPMNERFFEALKALETYMNLLQSRNEELRRQPN